MDDGLALPPNTLRHVQTKIAGAELELFRSGWDWTGSFPVFFRTAYQAFAGAYQGRVPTEEFVRCLESRIPAAVLQWCWNTPWIAARLLKETQTRYDEMKALYHQLGREWEDLPWRVTLIYSQFGIDHLIRELALVWSQAEYERIAECDVAAAVTSHKSSGARHADERDKLTGLPADLLHPEVLDFMTFQDLPPDAVTRLQQLRAQHEVRIRQHRNERGTDDVLACIGILPNDLSEMKSRIVEVASSLFEAIGREYLRVLADASRFEFLLDETVKRVSRFAVNRLLEVATGRHIQTWTELKVPSPAEFPGRRLLEECGDVAIHVRSHIGPIAEQLKLEAWQRIAVNAGGPANSPDGDNVRRAERRPSQAPADATDDCDRGSRRCFPLRAEWLRSQLAERAWNRNDPLRQGGPDPKTIDKVLRGEQVREDVLEKLAKSLSAKHSRIDLLAIPNG
jgi:hypothetical protein